MDFFKEEFADVQVFVLDFELLGSMVRDCGLYWIIRGSLSLDDFRKEVLR